MKKLTLLFAFTSILLSACRPAEAAFQQNGLAQTETANPPAPSPQGETPTPTETATAGEAEILSSAEMEEKGLVEGDTIRVRGEYEGIPVDVTFAISQAISDRLPGYGLKLITPEGSELSGKERVMKAVLLAFFRLYRERKYLSLEAYPFEQYLADIKAGKDLAVDVWLVDPATGEGALHKVSPTTPLTLIVTDQEVSPNGNVHLYYMEGSKFGFYVAPDQSIKIVMSRESSLFKAAEPEKKLPLYLTYYYQWILKSLGWPTRMQEKGVLSLKDASISQLEDSLAKEILELVCPTDPVAGYCVRGTQIFRPRGK